MQKQQRLVFEALKRVLTFLQAWAHLLSGVTDSGAHRELEETVARVAELTAQQDGTRYQQKRDLEAQRKARATVRNRWMRPIARISAAKLRSAAELEQLKLPPKRVDDTSFVRLGREMVAAATNHQEVFINTALPEDFVERFTAAIDHLEAMIDARQRGIGTRIGATALLRTAVAQGRRMMAVIDAMVLPEAEEADDMRADWERTKRVVLRAASDVGTDTDATPSTADVSGSRKEVPLDQ